MKKTFYVLGMAALMAGFTACNSGTETTDNSENTAVENTEVDAGAKCGEGKCGEGKCGGADTEGEKQDHFASIDTDGNGEISKEEFEAHIAVEFTEKDKNADGQITADECGKFDMLNKDGDDFISDEEFANGHNMMFEKMDKDASGTISKEEMEAQMKAMKAEMGEDADADAKCGEGKCGK